MLGKSTRRICGLICIFIASVCIWTTLISWLCTPIEGLNRTHYDILGVDIDASANEIKRAYRKRILPYHPDKVQRLSAAQRARAKSRYDEIHASYEFLSGDERCIYDVVVMKVSLREYTYCVERFQKQQELDLAFAREQKMKRFEEKRKEREERQREQEQEHKQEEEREQERAHSGEDLSPSTAELTRLESAFTRFKELFGRVVEIPYQVMINVVSFVAAVAIMTVR